MALHVPAHPQCLCLQQEDQALTSSLVQREERETEAQWQINRTASNQNQPSHPAQLTPQSTCRCVNKLTRDHASCTNLSRGDSLLYTAIAFFFYSRTCSIWKFPGKGSKSELQLWPTPRPQQHRIQTTSATYTVAIATWDPSCTCNLHHSLQQCQILNPLSEARDRTLILMDTSQVRNLLHHNGNSLQFLLLSHMYPSICPFTYPLVHLIFGVFQRKS